MLQLLMLGTVATAIVPPSDLRVDWQRSPALGVSTAPVFNWVVPSCPGGQKDAMQTSYRIKIYSDTVPEKLFYDSGITAGNTSVAVKYTGPPLKRGAVYQWTVSTESAGCSTSGSSSLSETAVFITECEWDKKAQWIGVGKNTSTFNILRKVVDAPPRSQVARIVGYITAQNSWSGMLMNYKLYINGKLVSVGPGRGEARIKGGDSRYSYLLQIINDTLRVRYTTIRGPQHACHVTPIGY
jgi:hypothetical protein